MICWLFSFGLSAQTSERERPDIKEFGKSLRLPVSETFQNNETDAETIRIETSFVRTDILVLDQRGKAVLGLTPEDFIVKENEITQEISTFSLGNSVDIPRSIVLIIDYSGSQLPYIATSIDAAKKLVNKLNPKDRMAIVTDDIKLLTDFTRDKNLLKEKLDSIADNISQGRVGKSLQYSALAATLRELFDSEDIRPIVIFQTDGDEFSEVNNEGVIRTIESSRATIYSVISGTSFIGHSQKERVELIKKIQRQRWGFASFLFTQANKHSDELKNQADKTLLEQESMRTTANVSGGFVENLEKPNDANQIYSRILNGINNRYLIGYYPLNQEHDGTRRNVKIEVKNHPEYVVIGRKFYYAPQSKK